jgi:hypothetical protein
MESNSFTVSKAYFWHKIVDRLLSVRRIFALPSMLFMLYLAPFLLLFAIKFQTKEKLITLAIYSFGLWLLLGVLLGLGLFWWQNIGGWFLTWLVLSLGMWLVARSKSKNISIDSIDRN